MQITSQEDYNPISFARNTITATTSQIHNKVVDITPFMEKETFRHEGTEQSGSFLVEDFYRQAEVAGIDMQAMIGSSKDDPFQAISFALVSQAEQIGKKAGVK